MAKKLRLPNGAMHFTNAIEGATSSIPTGRKGTERAHNATITEAMYQKSLKRMAEEKERQRKAEEAQQQEQAQDEAQASA